MLFNFGKNTNLFIELKVSTLIKHVVGHSHAGAQFLICDDCGKVIESNLDEIPEILKKSTENNTFKPLRWNLEINGLCSQCS